jgi:hypothetical protein
MLMRCVARTDIKIIVTDGEESDIGSDDSPRIRRVHTDSEDDVEPVVVKAKNNSLPRKGLATPLLDKLQNKLAPEVKVEQGVEVKVKNEDVQLGIKVEEDVKPDVAVGSLPALVLVFRAGPHVSSRRCSPFRTRTTSPNPTPSQIARSLFDP